MLEWQHMNKDGSTTSAMLPGPAPELNDAHAHDGRHYVVLCILSDRPDNAPDLVIAEEV